MTLATAQEKADVDDVSKCVKCVRSPTGLRLSRFCRSAQDDLYGTFKTVIGAIFVAVM